MFSVVYSWPVAVVQIGEYLEKSPMWDTVGPYIKSMNAVMRSQVEQNQKLEGNVINATSGLILQVVFNGVVFKYFFTFVFNFRNSWQKLNNDEPDALCSKLLPGDCAGHYDHDAKLHHGNHFYSPQTTSRDPKPSLLIFIHLIVLLHAIITIYFMLLCEFMRI